MKVHPGTKKYESMTFAEKMDSSDTLFIIQQIKLACSSEWS